MNIAFLDRDGTIVRDYPDEQWRDITQPEMLTGSVEGMKVLIERGYRLIVVTNQYIIDDGVITLEQYQSYTEKLITTLKRHNIELMDVFYCRHSSTHDCNCRKPAIGMFQEAQHKYPEINISESLMMGDSEADRLFAENIGLRFYGIRGGSLRHQEVCFDSIYEAIRNGQL